jgi:PKD repeat protein
LQGNLEETYWLIKATAEPRISAQCPPHVDHPNDVWGWGIIDALAAVQAGKLQGTVYDQAFAPLPGATVEVAPSGGGLVRQTIADANGTYSFTLAADDYAITATLSGYLPTTGIVSVVMGMTTVHDIVLEPLPSCEPVQEADFDWIPVTPTVGQVVTFTGVASGTSPITYTWRLEVGSWEEGQVVTHTYAQPGVYPVVMTATNCATATVTAVHTITVMGIPQIVLPPGLPPAELELGQQATYPFTVANTGTADLNWSLAEVPAASWLEETPVSGTVAPGGLAEVLLTYTAPMTTGVYTTALRIASNDPVSPAVDLLVELDVVTACIPVEIASITPEIAGCDVTLTAALTGTVPFTYLWGFGDGMTSTQMMPTHTYTQGGVYSGTLAVWNCGGTGYAVEGFTVEVECAAPRYAFYLPVVMRALTP